MENFIYILPIVVIVIVALVTFLLIKKDTTSLSKLKADIAEQEKQITEYKQISSSKQEELSRISQEYETAAKDLKASIHYAERIQSAVIPHAEDFKALFNDCFIYFSPRDIVSGDFYTCASSLQYKIAIVADCTGHGVPGGFLSMLGMSALKDLLSKQRISKSFDPADILNKLRTFVITSLAESSETDDVVVSDGMDISLCAFDNDFQRMQYSTANHTVYVCRDGEIQKLKGNRMPIGRHPKQDVPFESFTFDLQKGDMVYLCSDGIQDQFGTADDIKFTTKRLAAMLLEHSGQDTQTQLAEITKIVDNWKEGHDQFDDQTLIGIRI